MAAGSCAAVHFGKGSVLYPKCDGQRIACLLLFLFSGDGLRVSCRGANAGLSLVFLRLDEAVTGVFWVRLRAGEAKIGDFGLSYASAELKSEVSGSFLSWRS